jgi:alkanesulfonate monooxygenase SsuD/methylene tetrahydromethanopterin reductase-like flavin-dependent oxidoreductase (luciferase family)
MQIPARSASMTAMTAATLTRCPARSFPAGLGISGPAVSEGWHGVRFRRRWPAPGYVEIVRRLRRRGPLRYAGRHYQMPLPDGPGGR